MTAWDAITEVLGVREGVPTVISTATRERDFIEILRLMAVSTGAEIGVESGRFSEALCRSLPELRLTCVDAWAAHPGYREHVTQEKLDRIYADAVTRLAPYACAIVKGFSQAVAATVPDRSLDFVYVDANHTLPSVIADLAAWVPKVKRGGIVAGHDYGRRSVGHVLEAVGAWTKAYDISEWWVLGGDRSPSFLWVQS